jgi:molybdopterin molybdotransferase
MTKFLKVISPSAVLKILERFPPLDPETVVLENATGRVLAGAVVAGENIPAFPRATMDGFAVRARDVYGASEIIPALLEVVGKVEMGEAADQQLITGQAIAIPTGGMLPPGADAVVMVEHTQPLDDRTIEVTRPAAPGDNVLQAGEDLRLGEEVLPAGHRLRPQDAGLLAALGIMSVDVVRRPRVAVISTGDEVVPADTARLPVGKTRDINSFSLGGQLAQAELPYTLCGIVEDALPQLTAACRQALADHDVVLLSGGSSVGARDYTIQVLESLPGAEILFHGIAVRPGKPTILARVGQKVFWGLPGQPVSALTIFTAFVKPLLERLEGEREKSVLREATRIATLSASLPSVHGRSDYASVVLEEKDGRLWATPLFGKSAMISLLSRADGYVIVPEHSEGLDRGTEVRIHLFSG